MLGVTSLGVPIGRAVPVVRVISITLVVLDDSVFRVISIYVDVTAVIVVPVTLLF